MWPFSLPYKVSQWMTLKGQIKVIECLVGILSYTKYCMTEVYLKHIYEVIYDLSVYLNIF